MLLKKNGIDVFYIDESHDRHVFVVTAVCIPFLRMVEGIWTITWPAQFDALRAWRRAAKANVDIPVTKELHGLKLLSGRGNFKHGKYNFDRPKASAIYRSLLQNIDFLPPASVMSVAAPRQYRIYGNERLEAAMYALFQRMRKKCEVGQVNALTFFDQGHPEYRKLYRQAQRYLPTGSKQGGWQGGGYSKNLPLDMFFKDANEKDSKHCFFTQLADLIAYSAFLKIKGEQGDLTDWQINTNAGNIYDSVPRKFLNTNVSYNSTDAILRLK